ncbi:MAG TPA: hypothetical protein VKB47_02055 [Terracidiphilus sp.]|nr:hypothetical protein [Terracidiphilus sp.]
MAEEFAQTNIGEQQHRLQAIASLQDKNEQAAAKTPFRTSEITGFGGCGTVEKRCRLREPNEQLTSRLDNFSGFSGL